MKRTRIILVFLSLLSFFALAAQDAQTAVQNTKTLLNKVVAGTAAKGWDNPATPIEGGTYSLSKFSGFTELQSSIQKDWPEVMDHLDEFAPTDMSKSILFVSFQGLPSDQYIEFLEKATGLVEQGHLKKQFLYWALAPQDKNVRGVLELNSDNPKVKDIAVCVKRLYPDGKMDAFYNGITSGKSKEEFKAEETEMNTPKQ